MYPTTNLQPGMSGAEVRKLQNYLVQQGLMNQADITGPGTDVYGPRTTAAVAALQAKLGVDTAGNPGYWGPRTLAKLQSGGGGVVNNSVNTNNLNISEEDKALGEEARRLAEADPLLSSFFNAGNSYEDMLRATSTGDFSSITNPVTGKPFTAKEQQDALRRGEEDNRAYYEQLKEKETQDAESKLKQDQLDWQNYLSNQAVNFESDKSSLDSDAANRGVLFSGGRVQKQNALQSKYSGEEAYKRETLAGSIGDTARDYQYKYGNKGASGLSDYYKLGSNTYNATTGATGAGGLSRVYSPRDSDFAGTRIGERAAGANTFAADYLWNKANKIQLSGYNNKKY